LVSSTTGGANATFSQLLIAHGENHGATLFAEGVAVAEVAVIELISVEPVVDDSVDDTADDTNDDDKPVLDEGALAGIIIGAIAFMMIIVAFVFCMLRKNTKIGISAAPLARVVDV
jgi:hypothetical protein